MNIYDDNDVGYSMFPSATRGSRTNTSPLPRKNMTTREILEHCLANYNDDMEPVQPKVQQTIMPDPELEFDGENLYVKRNNIQQSSWPAMAGQPGYQNRASTSVSNFGPTPEGLYYANPDNLQENLSFSDRAQRLFNNPNPSLRDVVNVAVPTGKDSWMRSTGKWGNYRIPLEPDQNTNTYGRHSMYIHGSDDLGSEGCIDLGPKMDNLAPYIRNSRSPVKVRVKYKADDFER